MSSEIRELQVRLFLIRSPRHPPGLRLKGTKCMCTLTRETRTAALSQQGAHITQLKKNTTDLILHFKWTCIHASMRLLYKAVSNMKGFHSRSLVEMGFKRNYHGVIHLVGTFEVNYAGITQPFFNLCYAYFIGLSYSWFNQIITILALIITRFEIRY